MGKSGININSDDQHEEGSGKMQRIGLTCQTYKALLYLKEFQRHTSGIQPTNRNSYITAKGQRLTHNIKRPTAISICRSIITGATYTNQWKANIRWIEDETCTLCQSITHSEKETHEHRNALRSMDTPTPTRVHLSTNHRHSQKPFTS